MEMIPTMEIDLGTISRDELLRLQISTTLTIYVPLPSFGYSNSLIDICSDLIEASWAAEQISAFAELHEFDEDYDDSSHKTRIKLTLSGVRPEIRDALLRCQTAFDMEDDETEEEEDRREEVRESIVDYEDLIEETIPLTCPQLPYQ